MGKWGQTPDCRPSIVGFQTLIFYRLPLRAQAPRAVQSRILYRRHRTALKNHLTCTSVRAMRSEAINLRSII